MSHGRGAVPRGHGAYERHQTLNAQARAFAHLMEAVPAAMASNTHAFCDASGVRWKQLAEMPKAP
jgi:hypothetical protein